MVVEEGGNEGQGTEDCKVAGSPCPNELESWAN